MPLADACCSPLVTPAPSPIARSPLMLVSKSLFNGVTLEESIKDTVLAQLAQVKTMNLLAKEYEVELSEQEMEWAGAAAKEYYSSLNLPHNFARQPAGMHPTLHRALLFHPHPVYEIHQCPEPV